MRRILVQAGALALAAILGAIGVGVVRSAPVSSAPEPYFDRLLRLATVSDAAFDAVTERWSPPYGMQLTDWRDAIMRQIGEEGIKWDGRKPPPVSFVDFGDEGSQVAGKFTLAGAVELNARFVTDPAWQRIPWLDVLVHELIHAAGLRNEAQTSLVTYEVIAALADLGFPYAFPEVLDTLRRDALLAAWWIARYDLPVRPTTTGATGLRACNACETQPEVDLATGDVVRREGDVAQLERVTQARRAIFTPAEHRRVLARERYWTSADRDYAQALDAYVVRPLATILASICDDDPTLIEWIEWSGFGSPMPTPPILMDDIDAVLREIGGC